MYPKLGYDLMRDLARVGHVPYKGAAPAVADVMGGHVAMTFVPIAAALPPVRAGKLRPLGVTAGKRSPELPDVPTIDEAGVRGYEFDTWYGLLVPAGTPRPIIERLSRETAKVLESAAVKEQFTPQGIEAAPTSPEQFGAYLRTEVEKWGKVVKASGAKPE